MPKNKRRTPQAPAIDIAASYTPKHDLPTSQSWSDVVALFVLSIAALGLYYQSIWLCAAAFFGIVSLWINAPKSNEIVPTSFVAIFFCGFLVASQYVMILGGHRPY
jgi:hypothetical protein